MKNTPFLKNLRSHFLAINLIHLLYFLLAQSLMKFSPKWIVVLITAQSVFSIGMFIWLLKLRIYFVMTKEEKPIIKIGPANKLTLFRLLSVPTLCLLVYLSKESENWTLTAIWMSLAFITDFMDGKIARKTGQISEIGKMMDSSTDYLILFCTTFLLSVFQILPFWFFLLTFFRFLSQLPNVIFLYLTHKKIKNETSFLGKASVFSLMTLFGLEVILSITYFEGNLSKLLPILEYFTAFVLIISAGEKWLLFFKKLWTRENPD